MAVLTLEQLQDLFHGVTVTMTGLDETLVRNAYQPDGQPGFEDAQNVALLNITPADDPINRVREIKYQDLDPEHATETTGYTRVIECQWSFYGPASFDYADLVRFAILTESIRETLRASKVFPIPDIPEVVRLPYGFNTQWRERTDLFVRFNVGVERTATVPYFSGVNVNVVTDDGTTQRTFSIQP